ncbi:MAG: transcriptional regulator NrdR [Clostridia bacterium]
MNCPFCNYDDSKVVDSRPTEEGDSIRRRRECLSCQKRFTTYETIERVAMYVIKKDGSRQAFDKSKILNGLLRACEKRPVPLAVLEDVANQVEQLLQNSLEREVSSQTIGELIMRKLKLIDQVAYVRFVSVYRSFDDVETFLAELKSLRDAK